MRHATPTSGVSDCMPSGKTAAKSSVGAKRQVAENMMFSLTEPNLARFAQKETKALQRPKIAALPVSEVRLVWPNPFEYTKNSAAVGGALRVCKRKLAEREGFEPPMPLQACRISSAVHSTALPPLRSPKRAAKTPIERPLSNQASQDRQGTDEACAAYIVARLRKPAADEQGDARNPDIRPHPQRIDRNYTKSH